MDESKDDAEYAKTFRHEMGHYIDDMLGNTSMHEDFENAIDADKFWLDNSTTLGLENFQTMIDDLTSFDIMDSMYVSDILSGVFLNDTKIIEAYENTGMSFYGHDVNTYWLAWDKDAKIVQRETFANLFAVFSSNRSSEIEFLEKWFPNTVKRFQMDMEVRAIGC